MGAVTGLAQGAAQDVAANPVAGVLAPGIAGNAAVLNNIPGAKGVLNGIVGPIQQNGGLLGLPGAAPELANLQQGTTVQDVRGAAQRTGEALNSQDALLKALQAQGGLGMQNQAAGNLQNTASMYQNIAQGGGPNPAQAMLNQATGQNVANQAALMAGQRGAGANVGLMARQAAQQGANTQQQAVGQGATMQANQQLNALQGLTGAQQAYGNIANQIAGQQIGQANANTQANLANQGQVQNALQGFNNASVSNQGNVNAANAGLSQANTAGKQAILGGIMQGAGAAIGAARGGMVHMATGGPIPAAPAVEPNMSMMPAPMGPQSSFGQYLVSNPFNAPPPETDNEKVSEEDVKKKTEPKFTGSSLEKGTASMTSAIGKGLAGSRGGLANGGGPVAAKKDSEKAAKAGNSYSNDKIPAMLSEGEIVLPRSVTQSKDPTRAAANFVSAVLAKRKVKK